MIINRPFRGIALALLIACTANARAGKLEKAFAALELHDYFKARTLLLTQVKKHPAAAWYGLSVIQGRDNNPFYHLDSAYACLQRSDAAFTTTDDRERMRIKPLGVHDDAIRAQREHLYDLAWQEASALNTIDAYDRFAKNYERSARAEEAKILRDHLAYEEAREKNTAAAYEDFMLRYPEARDIFLARSRAQEAIYREATPDRSIEQYATFIRASPESPYRRNAEDEIYRIATAPHTPAAFHRFILDWPKNPRVNEAWRALYELSTKDLSTNTTTSFLKTYPDYPFVTELGSDYAIASLRLLPFRRDSLWGFIDEQGIERIKAQYDWVEDFHNGQALVSRGERVGTINKNGKEVIAIQYDDVQEYTEGLATVERGGKVGVVDRSGELRVPMDYTEVGEFVNGLAYAERDDAYGFIDANGGERIAFGYTSAAGFKNGFATVEKDDRAGVIDAKGAVVVPFAYDWVEGFTNGVSRVRNGDHMGLIDARGNSVLPVEHEHVGTFNDGLALVIDHGKCGYVDTAGKWAIAQQYDAPEGTATWGDFHNGFAEVMKKGKHGLIDGKGQVFFPIQWQDLGSLDDGLVPVKKNDRWAYADLAMNVRGAFAYDMAWELKNGYARVKTENGFGMIDSTGELVINPGYGKLSDARSGLVVAMQDDRSGVLDVRGNTVLPFDFDAITLADAPLVRLERAGALAWYRLDTRSWIWKEAGFDAPR